MSKLGNFDGVENLETPSKNKVETVPSATENDRKKLDHINDSKTSKFNSSELKNGLDSNKGKDVEKKGRLNNRDLGRQPEKQGDLVQTGTALENPSYGAGGGKQYFIPDAHQELKGNGNLKLENGSLIKTGETNLQHINPSYLSKNKIKNEKQKTQPAEIEKQTIKPTISVNNSPLSESERAEWEDLDKNTMDERGLPKVMTNKEDQFAEYWKHASSNQEVRGTSTYPDAWSNPRNLKDGEKFYQLRPSNAKDASEYFTNAATVNKCRNENGDVNTEKLLQALQIDPGQNTNWTLREYEYRKNK